MVSTMLSFSRPSIEPGVVSRESSFVNPDDLRTAFALAMSVMYKNEVPLYHDLTQIVQSVNRIVLSTASPSELPNTDSFERLSLERHGAIRLGKPEELYTVRRIFALLGMKPVGYYDLSVAGLPMHATCFRPTDTSSLSCNPFRVFTTLLRPDLIRSDETRDLALQLLSKRDIFSDELLRSLEIADSQEGRLRAEQAEVFIREGLRTFSWQPTAAATNSEYQMLRAEHPILADIACFKTAHINHLTPRTLDIELAHKAMCEVGMTVKNRIEGPPLRKYPILLRQTSFIALEESTRFKGQDGDNGEQGSHQARFGEIEQRGAAVTPAGRELYDKLLSKATADAEGQSPQAADTILARVFEQYPDTWAELRKKGLVYCRYHSTGKKPIPSIVAANDITDLATIEKLVDQGVLETSPITYEDFLPFSAAGIFRSNLSHDSRSDKESMETIQANQDTKGMETALGCSITDPDWLYATAQRESLEASLRQLKSLVSDYL